jgi:hypothetical protein
VSSFSFRGINSSLGRRDARLSPNAVAARAGSLPFAVETGVLDLALSLDGGVSFVRGDGVFARSLSGPGVYELLSSRTRAGFRVPEPSYMGGGGGMDEGDGIIE